MINFDFMDEHSSNTHSSNNCDFDEVAMSESTKTPNRLLGRNDDDESEYEDGRQGRIEATLVILAQNHRFGDRPVPRPLARVSHGRSGRDAGDAGDSRSSLNRP